MRNLVNSVLGGIGLTLALAASASAETLQWKVQSSVSDVYVRSNPGGFMIGTLYANDSFRWKQTNGSDFWGRAGGTAQMCGWVPSAYLTPGGQRHNRLRRFWFYGDRHWFAAVFTRQLCEVRE